MGERETVTAGAWEVDGDWWVRRDVDTSLTLARVLPDRWYVWSASDPDAVLPAREGDVGGQQGRDAADAALRADGVVLL